MFLFSSHDIIVDNNNDWCPLIPTMTDHRHQCYTLPTCNYSQYHCCYHTSNIKYHSNVISEKIYAMVPVNFQLLTESLRIHDIVCMTIALVEVRCRGRHTLASSSFCKLNLRDCTNALMIPTTSTGAYYSALVLMSASWSFSHICYSY